MFSIVSIDEPKNLLRIGVQRLAFLVHVVVLVVRFLQTGLGMAQDRVADLLVDAEVGKSRLAGDTEVVDPVASQINAKVGSAVAQ